MTELENICPLNFLCVIVKSTSITSVLESPGKPVTGSQSILKGCHNSLIEGSPSIIVSPVCNIEGLPVINQVKMSKT